MSATTLLKLKDVPISNLQPYDPGSGEFTVDLVSAAMAWSATQSGLAGAVPTFLPGSASESWQVALILEHDEIDVVSVTQDTLARYTASGVSQTENWGKAVNRFIETQSSAEGTPYLFAIPMAPIDFCTPAVVDLLAFTADYPGVAALEIENQALFYAAAQPETLIDLNDGTVWIWTTNVYVAARGYSAVWPNWEKTTVRGAFALWSTALAPAPDMNATGPNGQTNLANVIGLLNACADSLQAAAQNTGTYVDAVTDVLEELPITDPAYQIAWDLVSGMINAFIRLIPEVGGFIAGVLSTLETTVIDQMKTSLGDDGHFDALAYLSALYYNPSTQKPGAVQQLQDTVQNLVGGLTDVSTQQETWSQEYTDPVSGRTLQVGQLADVDECYFYQSTAWTNVMDAWSAAWFWGYVQQAVGQQYQICFQSFADSVVHTQRWPSPDGCDALTATGGAVAQYVSAEEHRYSYLYVNLLPDGDSYCGSDVWWLSSAQGLPTYSNQEPPGDVVQLLFSSDGYGTKDEGTGVLKYPYPAIFQGTTSKQALYGQWFIPRQIIYDGVIPRAYWVYDDPSGRLVAYYYVEYDGNDNPFGVRQAYTDEHGTSYIDGPVPPAHLQVVCPVSAWPLED